MTKLSRRRFGALTGAALLAVARADRLAAQDAARTHRVVIRSFRFVPDHLMVRVGDTVEWLNHDLAPHTATEVDGGHDTGRIDRGATGRITFERAGDLDYRCTYHPHMCGRIAVAGPSRV